MTYIEETMKSDRVYEGKIINVRIDVVELPDKKYSKREIVEHSGGVAVVAINNAKKVLLVKQYRKAVDKVLLELPAGKLEVNEEPKQSAIRELKEETGYSTEKLEYVTEFYTSPGFSTEKIYIFFTDDIKEGVQELESGEFIDVVSYSFEEIDRMIKLGDIIDGKTIIGIKMAQDMIKEL